MNKKMKKFKDWCSIASFRRCQFFVSDNNKIERAIKEKGEEYDRDNFELIVRMVKSGNVCFDIGANIGVYSVIFASLSGQDELVHAFEPVTHIRTKMYANLKLNGFVNANVNPFALGSSCANMTMYQIREGQFRGGVSSFVINENYDELGADAYEERDVEILTLDGYVEDRKIDRIDFIKIDVEGFELDVLKGAKEVLKKFSPYLLFEYDPERVMNRNSEIRDLLIEARYRTCEFKFIEGQIVFRDFDFSRKPIQRNLFCLPCQS